MVWFGSATALETEVTFAHHWSEPVTAAPVGGWPVAETLLVYVPDPGFLSRTAVRHQKWVVGTMVLEYTEVTAVGR